MTEMSATAPVDAALPVETPVPVEQPSGQKPTERATEAPKNLLERVKNWLPFWREKTETEPQEVVEDIAQVDQIPDQPPEPAPEPKTPSLKPTSQAKATTSSEVGETILPTPNDAQEAKTPAKAAQPKSVEETTKTPESPIEKVLDEFPKKEDAVYLIGQHSGHEPIAKIVGEQIATGKQQLGYNTPLEIFPGGKDYTDALSQAKEAKKLGDARDIGEIFLEKMETLTVEGISDMAKVAEQHPDQVIYNFHEHIVPWELDDSMVVSILLPPRLTPPALEAMKQFSSQLNSAIDQQDIPLTLQISSVADRKGPRQEGTKYGDVPPNMVVIEIYTPSSLYEPIDSNIKALGNNRLKATEENKTKIKNTSERYISALQKVLPTITQEYSQYLNPRYDMKTHDPDF